MTSALTPDILTKRERHIMDVLCRRGHATAREVMSEMAERRRMQRSEHNCLSTRSLMDQRQTQ